MTDPAVEWEPLTGPAIFADADMAGPRGFAVAGLRVALFCSRAPDRESANQDSAAILPVGPDAVVFAVADGVGGGPSGDKASRLALEALAASLDQAEHDQPSLRSAILDGVEMAGEAVAALGTGAATTLVVTQFENTSVRTYHVGDSEAFVVGQRGRMKLQTVSHTPSGYGLEAGLLTAREAIEHEERHVVLNLVGASDMRIEIGPEIGLSPRDTLVLGSDGLFDNWPFERIVDRVRRGRLRDIATLLADQTRTRMVSNDATPAKPDDLTFMIARRPSRVSD